MPILKAPPVQPKNDTLQLRVSQDLKFRLMCYAEFLHAPASYVVSEALERLFRKDAEFQEYLATHQPPQAGDHRGEKKALPPRNEAGS
jgi:predicted transcriptional regulator